MGSGRIDLSAYHVIGLKRMGSGISRKTSLQFFASPSIARRGVFVEIKPMSKAFTKETEVETDLEEEDVPALPAGAKNYITPEGLQRLRDEFRQLQQVERPKIVETVSWAAGNGDRSENGDYIYGKKRL